MRVEWVDYGEVCTVMRQLQTKPNVGMTALRPLTLSPSLFARTLTFGFERKSGHSGRRLRNGGVVRKRECLLAMLRILEQLRL